MPKAIQISHDNVLQIATGQRYLQEEEIRSNIGMFIVVDYGETGITQGYLNPKMFEEQFVVVEEIYHGWLDVRTREIPLERVPLAKE